MTKKKKLTEKQQKVLDVLFEEADGDMTQAIRLAGYAPSVKAAAVLKTLEDEVLALTKQYFSRVAPRVAMSVMGIINDPTALGNREKLAAARDLLDRAGLSKTDKVEVTGGGGIVILPAKDNASD